MRKILLHKIELGAILQPWDDVQQQIGAQLTQLHIDGMGRIIGAHRLSALAEALQIAADDANWPEIERLAPEVEEVSAAAIGFVDDYRARE